MKIKRRLKRKKNAKYCECGCGQEIKIGNRFINGHNWYNRKHSDETKLKMSKVKKGKHRSEETKKKISLSCIGRKFSKETRKKISLAGAGNQHNKGKKASNKTKIKMSISSIKGRNDGYCDAWSDDEYKKECRKGYCENKGCNGNSEIMNLHHINLDPLDCRPINLITLCASCHLKLHWKLYNMNNKTKAKEDYFIVLIKKDRIIYIHKETRQKVEIQLLN